VTASETLVTGSTDTSRRVWSLPELRYDRPRLGRRTTRRNCGSRRSPEERDERRVRR
jgi:hypothetical protein